MRASLRPTSSLTMDFDLATVFTPFCFAMSTTMRQASEAFSAQCTTAPRAAVSRSKRSR